MRTMLQALSKPFQASHSRCGLVGQWCLTEILSTMAHHWEGRRCALNSPTTQQLISETDDSGVGRKRAYCWIETQTVSEVLILFAGDILYDTEYKSTTYLDRYLASGRLDVAAWNGGNTILSAEVAPKDHTTYSCLMKYT